jgi:hypothetical protein
VRRLNVPSPLRLVAILLALVAGAARAADDAPVDPDAPQMLGRLLESMRRALPPGPPAAALGEALEQAAELALEHRAEAAMRRRASEEQARRLEQLYGPIVHVELETVRMSCPGLEPQARRALVTASRQAVRELAMQHAAASVRGAAPPGQTVAKLDERFELTARQREAILADLRDRWEPAWIRELDDRDGMMINDQRPAPDFAEGCIAPHLDAEQRRAWQQWCQAAGRRRLGIQLGNWSGVPGALKLDPWWNP